MCFWKILGAGREWITAEHDWRQDDQEGGCLDLQEGEDEVLAQSRGAVDGGEFLGEA